MAILNVIIAGANKAGTTSLFRYLADHPQVCASGIKETNFFQQAPDYPVGQLMKLYDAHFPQCTSETRIRLEASPGYLSGGAEMASRIHEVLPEARLIFSLREPGHRIMSYFFRNKQTQFHERLAAMDLPEFIDLLEWVTQSPQQVAETGPARNALIQFHRGCYAELLQGYRKYFPKKHIEIIFFDRLVTDTTATVQSICRKVGVNPEFYNNYAYEIENKTRQYRYPSLQKMGSHWGRRLEVVLNRVPRMRRTLRNLLLTKDAGDVQKCMTDKDWYRIRSLYSTVNRDLYEFLRAEYPEHALPSWLSNVASN